VIFWPLVAGILELSTASDITINGISQDDFFGVAAASGDINNDGVEDLIFGAFRADPLVGRMLGRPTSHLVKGLPNSVTGCQPLS